jgi:hypothetical protein
VRVAGGAAGVDAVFPARAGAGDTIWRSNVYPLTLAAVTARSEHSTATGISQPEFLPVHDSLLAGRTVRKPQAGHEPGSAAVSNKHRGHFIEDIFKYQDKRMARGALEQKCCALRPGGMPRCELPLTA